MGAWTGELRLDAEERKGKTVAKNVYFQGALKVMRPIYHDHSGQACYYLLNPGGGYLDGDRYKMRISLDEQAKLTLTTQSATKVYKTPNSHVYQETEIYLNEGSFLEYLPDPLIAYEHSRYKQKNVVHMSKNATFLYTDIITPGWSPGGERFRYDSIQLINEIYVDHELAVYDHIKLSPSTQNLSGLGFMEGYTHLGSMIAVGEQSDALLLDRLFHVMKDSADVCKSGISLLHVPGFAIRILANSTQVIESIFAACLQIIRQEWFNTQPSFLRKY
ncbi:urease accessory protein UreD [Paenibacillus terrigena]|uniref:urease accessory protein UreD n=1 Tax=Paenibacillus terrigena TaxID=369333 RepID=UPI0028D611D4|nr:urease accessory protein UreD [Paenibacillus terrigena]